jgi:hypothetical protein
MGNQDLNLDELHLDLTNPRFDGLSSERAALEKIVATQGIKLVNLAEDIVNKGMSPAHRMLVKHTAGKKSTGYVVVDGNRRLAALRVLTNPSVLDGMKDVGDLTSSKLRKLAERFDASSIQPLETFVCKDEAEARHWIEAIHTGENDGRGVVGWDGIATARYRGEKASLKVLEFIRSTGKLSAAELPFLDRFPITNLDRLLGSPEVRERLGLTTEGGDLLSDLPQAELFRPLRRIVHDLATKKVRVSQIKSKQDRVKYVDSLGADLPNLSKRTGLSQPLDRLAAQAHGRGHSSKSASTKIPSLIDRKTLIPPQNQCALNITDHKLQQICRELRKLPLDTYPVAVAASFRVFLELSLDHYASENKLAGYIADLKLKVKVQSVSSGLQTAGVSKRDLQAFRALANSSNAALNIDRLHGVIHSRYALPTASELRNGWAEVQVAFTKIWA